MDIAIGPRLEKALKVYLTACRRLRTERDVDGLLNLLVSVVDPELRLHMRHDLRDLSAGASRAEVRAQAAALSARWSV